MSGAAQLGEPSNLSPMNTATATAIFRTDLAASKTGAPEWIELFPAGPELNARDGRRWTAAPEDVLAAFNANNAPLPIDYEHGQDHLATQGHEAPAAGWIVELENRNGAVWGRVEWTDRAAAMIAAREYRFVSPAFNTLKNGKITRLLGAGLVNRPALEMTALSRETPQTTENDQMKAIAKALGLDEGADEKAILAAIAARDTERTALLKELKLDPAQAGQEEAAAAIASLRQESETATAALKSAPEKAELAAVRQTLADTQTALAALQKKDADREIDLALDEATNAGKITPASRDKYRAMCAAEGGLDRFKELASTLPVICEPSTLDTRRATTREETIDPVELAAEATKYQTEQRAAGINLSYSEAVFAVKDKKEKSA